MQNKDRGEILAEARDIINNERLSEYGSPEDSFKLIAGYWTTYLTNKTEGEGEPIVVLDAKDVALMMTLFKIARESNQGKRDNLVDAAGYIGIAGDMEPAPEKMGDTAAYKKGFEDGKNSINN